VYGLRAHPVDDHGDVAAFFNDIAATYGETHGAADALLAYRVGVLRQLLAPTGGRLLEVGCGAGIHLAALAPDYDSLVAVDVSSAMLERTQATLARAGRQATLTVDQAETLATIESGSVDAVIVVGVYEHLLDKTAALRAIHRVLRPGGALALMTPDARFLWYRIARRAHFGFHRLSTDSLVSADQLARQADGAGLEVQRASTWSFVPAGDMPRFVAPLFAALSRSGRPSLCGGLSIRAIKPVPAP